MQFSINIGADPGKAAVRLPDGSLDLFDMKPDNQNAVAQWIAKLVKMEIARQRAELKHLEEGFSDGRG